MRWRSALLLLLLGFTAGALVFFVLERGWLPGLPTSPGLGDEERLSLLEDAALAAGRLEARYPELRRAGVAPGNGQTLRLELHERDLRDLLLAALARRPEGRKVLEMSRAVRAEIDGGVIGCELVLDLQRLPRESLSEKERATVDRVLRFLPAIGEEELPIGFYGTPEARDGKIRLGGEPRVKVSILKLSLGTLGERLGISEQELEDSLEIEWPGFQVLEINPRDDALEVVVRAA